jgi:ATP-dependent helicase HepA
VLFSGTSCEAGLVHCYQDGLHVYTTSISGLEFALRDVERSLVRTAIDSGQEGLDSSAGAIADAARRERESDDSEAVLDEASFERTAAARFLQVGRSDRTERALEEAFVSYFRALGGGHGVRARTEDGNLEGVWRFRPEETRYGALPVDAGGKEVLVGDHDGTFRRTIAQRRPRLEFFSVGNPLFDAVIRSLSLHATGRVYAVECLVPGAEPWIGFEFVFTAAPNRQLLEGNAGLLNQAEAAFARARPVHLFYGTDGTLVQNTERLLGIRTQLAHAQEGVSWWDLASRNTEALLSAVGTADWQDVLVGLHGAAAAEAKARLSADLLWSLTADSESIAESRARAEREGAVDECSALNLLARAIAEWRVVLDGVGLFCVNGKLHRASR